MKKVLLIFVCGLLLFSGCMKESTNNTNIGESDIKMKNVKVIINDKEYVLNLENNITAKEFNTLLPQEFNMNDLNGNEKYVNMDSSLPTNSYYPKHIEKGDVMLFGDNCLVIFYKSFDTEYDYTKIGHIDNLDDLGSGNVIVKLES